MDYRQSQRWGKNISTTGIGGTYLPYMSPEETDRLLGVAFDNGINIIDMATDGPEAFPKIGDALTGRRHEMNLALHLGLTFTDDSQYLRTRDLNLVTKGFEKQLKDLKTDYADVGYIHYVDEQHDFDNILNSGMFEYALRLREKGVIRKLGFASHRADICRQFLDTGEIDLFMFSINPAYDIDPIANNPLEEDLSSHDKLTVIKERAELYNYAVKQGAGITVMKALGSGRLLSESTSPFGRAMTVSQCIRYCLDRPAVVSCMIGVKSAAELEGVLSYYKAADSELDYSFIAGSRHEDMSGKCVYCNHCLPCPVNIDIASVHKFMDLFQAGDELAKQHYLSMKHKVSECIQCGSCEDNCPFGVDILDNFASIKKIFGV